MMAVDLVVEDVAVAEGGVAVVDAALEMRVSCPSLSS